MVIILFYFQMQYTVNSSAQDIRLQCGSLMLRCVLVHPWTYEWIPFKIHNVALLPKKRNISWCHLILFSE